MRTPTHTLEKEKLTIRLIGQDDLVSLFQFLDQNRSRLSAWSSWLECIQTEHECGVFLQLLEDHRKLGIAESWGLWRDQKLIGIVYVFNSEAKNRRASIVAMIDRGETRKGLGYMLGVHAIDYCFNVCGVHRLECRVLSKEVSCNKFAASLGFQQEGEFKDSVWINDQPQDEIQYSLLMTDWNKSQVLLH